MPLLRHCHLTLVGLACCFAAHATPVSYAPGELSPWFNVSRPAGSYDEIRFLASLTDVDPNDLMSASAATGVNGSDYPLVGTTHRFSAGPSILDYRFFSLGFATNPGVLALRLGTESLSPSAITYNNIRVELYRKNQQVEVLRLDRADSEIPEPGSIGLAALGLAASVLARRRSPVGGRR